MSFIAGLLLQVIDADPNVDLAAGKGIATRPYILKSIFAHHIVGATFREIRNAQRFYSTSYNQAAIKKESFSGARTQVTLTLCRTTHPTNLVCTLAP